MSALMSDLIDGRVDARTANAMCSAGRNLLAIVEMEHRYGKKPQERDDRVLALAP